MQIYKVKSKGKGLPRQTEVAQGVPGRLWPLIFLTFRHYKGGRSSAIRTGRLYPRINSLYSLSEAESTSGHMVLSGEPRRKFPVTPPGIDPRTVQIYRMAHEILCPILASLSKRSFISNESAIHVKSYVVVNHPC